MDDNEAIEIIKRLANGVDPFTGEVFPNDSPYQNTQTTRALFTAIDALSNKIKKVERKRKLPARAGASWEKTESDLLIQKFDTGISIKQLAIEHQRTHGAIISQLSKLGKFQSLKT